MKNTNSSNRRFDSTHILIITHTFDLSTSMDNINRYAANSHTLPWLDGRIQCYRLNQMELYLMEQAPFHAN